MKKRAENRPDAGAGVAPDIACAVTAEQAAELTGVETGCGGITYPAGGWLCPQQLTAELLALAATRGLHVHYGYQVER
jgi:tRNA 5-methylaminomethyl-2-thiouridine biosynthesis bifunctional protein